MIAERHSDLVTGKLAALSGEAHLFNRRFSHAGQQLGALAAENPSWTSIRSIIEHFLFLIVVHGSASSAQKSLEFNERRYLGTKGHQLGTTTAPMCVPYEHSLHLT